MVSIVSHNPICPFIPDRIIPQDGSNTTIFPGTGNAGDLLGPVSGDGGVSHYFQLNREVMDAALS